MALIILTSFDHYKDFDMQRVALYDLIAISPLTSIILEIDYDDPDHPEFSIVEALGTITEFDWTHNYYDYFDSFRDEPDWDDEDKGGIHDPQNVLKIITPPFYFFYFIIE